MPTDFASRMVANVFARRLSFGTTSTARFRQEPGRLLFRDRTAPPDQLPYRCPRNGSRATGTVSDADSPRKTACRYFAPDISAASPSVSTLRVFPGVLVDRPSAFAFTSSAALASLRPACRVSLTRQFPLKEKRRFPSFHFRAGDCPSRIPGGFGGSLRRFAAPLTPSPPGSQCELPSIGLGPLPVFW